MTSYAKWRAVLLNDCLKSGHKPPQQLSLPDDIIITSYLEQSFLQLASELRTSKQKKLESQKEEASNSNFGKFETSNNTTLVFAFKKIHKILQCFFNTFLGHD